MELREETSEISQKSNSYSIPIIKRIKLSDLKTDAFLAGNVLDAVLTYIALQEGPQVTEFNSVLYTVMNTIGVGPTMFLKVALCVGILWTLRRTGKEQLLLPLALIFVLIALVNLLVIRSQGIEI